MFFITNNKRFLSANLAFMIKLVHCSKLSSYFPMLSDFFPVPNLKITKNSFIQQESSPYLQNAHKKVN